MSEVVVGRKRTAGGVLFEIRAIGEDPEELTEYVRTLLAAADIVIRELRKRRVQIALVAVPAGTGCGHVPRPGVCGGCALTLGCDVRDCIDPDCAGGEHCAVRRESCTHVRATHKHIDGVPLPCGVCPDCGRVFPRVAS